MSFISKWMKHEPDGQPSRHEISSYETYKALEGLEKHPAGFLRDRAEKHVLKIARGKAEPIEGPGPVIRNLLKALPLMKDQDALRTEILRHMDDGIDTPDKIMDFTHSSMQGRPGNERIAETARAKWEAAIDSVIDADPATGLRKATWYLDNPTGSKTFDLGVMNRMLNAVELGEKDPYRAMETCLEVAAMASGMDRKGYISNISDAKYRTPVNVPTDPAHAQVRQRAVEKALDQFDKVCAGGDIHQTTDAYWKFGILGEGAQLDGRRPDMLDLVRKMQHFHDFEVGTPNAKAPKVTPLARSAKPP